MHLTAVDGKPELALERLGEARDVEHRAAQHDPLDRLAATLHALEIERVAHLAGDLANPVGQDRVDVVVLVGLP